MPLSKRDKIKLAVLLLLWFAVFYPIVPEMVSDWASHSDNNHGFLVPLMTLYFIWQKKDQLHARQMASSPRGAVVLVGSILVFLLSYAGGTAFPARIAMVTSLFGLVWYCLGSEWMRVLRFPVLFLLFMVPVPYSVMSLVSLPLQLLATKLSENLIQFCSIPVYREGNMLFFAGTQLEVAEACSGIRSIMSLTMLGCVFAYMSHTSWRRRLALIASALPIAMVANILRITGTGILANFYGDKVARGFLHEFSGIVVFAIGLVALGLLYSMLNRKAAYDAA